MAENKWETRDITAISYIQPLLITSDQAHLVGLGRFGVLNDRLELEVSESLSLTPKKRGIRGHVSDPKLFIQDGPKNQL